MVNKIKMLLALVGFIFLMPGLVQADTIEISDSLYSHGTILPGNNTMEVISTANAVEDIKPMDLPGMNLDQRERLIAAGYYYQTLTQPVPQSGEQIAVIQYFDFEDN